jgi:hypothetical protein
LEVQIGDTLLATYLGHKNLEFPIQDTQQVSLILKTSATTLAEVEIVYEKHSLTASEVMKTVYKKWEKNKLSPKQSYLLNLTTDITITENDRRAYQYKGNHNLIRSNKKRFLAEEKDTLLRTQIGFLDSNIFLQPQSSPYAEFGYLFKGDDLKKDDSKYYSFEFGNQRYYKDDEVYHIKVHRKGGKGYCEFGGFYLVSKSNFDILYMELSAILCPPYLLEKGNETGKLLLDYAHIKVHRNKILADKYSVSKIEQAIRCIYKISSSNDIVSNKTTSIVVNSIKPISNQSYNTAELRPLKQVLYKHPGKVTN